MTRFILDERYALRGWDKLPFALVDSADGRAGFFRKEQFMFLMDCDGMHDIDLDALPEDQRTWVADLEKRRVIVPCGEGTMLLPRQMYHAYPCRYKHSVH